MSEWLHFLNLQYWYCIVYSLFGGRCAYLEELRQEQEAGERGFFDRLVEMIVSGGSAVWDASSAVLVRIWELYSAFAWSLSGFLAMSILGALAALTFLRLRELNIYGTLPPKTEEEKVARKRWEELLEGVLSSDPKRWRESILASDVMLGELLEELGVPGATTPDRMRALPEEAFATVPQAWEAHRVRNFISSGASDFILTQREAYRVMKLYEQVFEEFSFI